MFTIYALYNKQYRKIYIGQTESLSKRLDWHGRKVFSDSYTAKLAGGWVLVYTEPAATRREALKREKQLKSYRGRQFIKTFIPG